MFRNSVACRHQQIAYRRCDVCGVEFVEEIRAYPEIGIVGTSTRTECERCTTAADKDERLYAAWRAGAAKYRRN